MPCRAVFLLLVSGFSVFFWSHAQAEQGKVIFAFPEIGYPPYLIHGDINQNGIVYDIFETVANSIGYEVIKLKYPEKRIELMLARGQIDAHPSAQAWVEAPGQFAWTDPIIIVQDNLVYRKDNPPPGTTVAALIGMSLAAMRNFRYPSLESPFANGKIRRYDTRSFESILKLVAKKRAAAGILDQYVGNWTLQNKEIDIKIDDLAFSETGFDPVGFRVRFTPSKDWAPFLEKFNTELEKFKKTETYQKILIRYK